MSAAWDVLSTALADAGCVTVFGVPTDEPGLLDAAASDERLTAIMVRDQRAGACQAAGYAMVANRPAVLALSSGPAFLNALVGISEAASVGAPLIVVTTRIPSAGLGRGGFQELDQLQIAAPFVGWEYRVERVDRLGWAARRAVSLAQQRRPSVTLLEITSEVLAADQPVGVRSPPPVPAPRCVPIADDLRRAASVLRGARRPLIVAGGGTRTGECGAALHGLARIWGAALSTTATGRGAVNENDPMAVGLVGLYATPPLSEVFEAADVILAVGTRWEETATMQWPGLHTATVVHIDRDVTVFDQVVPATVALLGDARSTVELLIDALRVAGPGRIDLDWRQRVAQAREAAARRCARTFAESPAVVTIQNVVKQLGDQIVLVQDNGLHDIWSYHFPLLTIGPGSTVVTPGEQTMMGFGLAAAVGAALAEVDRPVLAICGDGAFAMSLAALSTATEHGCGLLAVVLDNGGFGWPRLIRQQEGVGDELTRFRPPNSIPDMARAHGALAATARTEEEVTEFLRTALPAVRAGRVAILHVSTPDTDVPPGIRTLFGNE